MRETETERQRDTEEEKETETERYRERPRKRVRQRERNGHRTENRDIWTHRKTQRQRVTEKRERQRQGEASVSGEGVGAESVSPGARGSDGDGSRWTGPVRRGQGRARRDDEGSGLWLPLGPRAWGPQCLSVCDLRPSPWAVIGDGQASGQAACPAPHTPEPQGWAVAACGGQGSKDVNKLRTILVH